jgi:Tfp pilus assembly protein PilF
VMRRALWILSACAVLTACAGPAPIDTAARERASIRLALAQAYHEEGQHHVALEEVERSLAIDVKQAPAHVLHGLILMALRQPERARSSLDQALALDGRLVSAWHNRAWLSCQSGQWAAAQADFAQALVWASGAERAQALMVDGVCAARAQAWDRAEQRLTQALDLEPGGAIPLGPCSTVARPMGAGAVGLAKPQHLTPRQRREPVAGHPRCPRIGGH